MNSLVGIPTREQATCENMDFLDSHLATALVIYLSSLQIVKIVIFTIIANFFSSLERTTSLVKHFQVLSTDMEMKIKF